MTGRQIVGYLIVLWVLFLVGFFLGAAAEARRDGKGTCLGVLN